VFSWDESSAKPTETVVPVAWWSNEARVSITPDGRNWLGNADSSQTGATLAGNDLWFAWGSAEGGANSRPHPFARIVRIDSTTMKLVGNIDLWHPEYGVYYAALSTNANGEVGVSYAIGGGPRVPTHVVGILTGTRREVATFASKRGPNENKWGDYLAVRRNYPNEKLFCATGYSLPSGNADSDATPNITIFGRSRDV
jgi:hypothetical protein